MSNEKENMILEKLEIFTVIVSPPPPPPPPPDVSKKIVI